MEKIDALFDMVANIAQEITGMKAEITEIKTEITGIKTRLDRIEQKVDVLVEQVADLTEFKNEMGLQFNKISTIVAENSMDIRLLKKVVSG